MLLQFSHRRISKRFTYTSFYLNFSPLEHSLLIPCLSCTLGVRVCIKFCCVCVFPVKCCLDKYFVFSATRYKPFDSISSRLKRMPGELFQFPSLVYSSYRHACLIATCERNENTGSRRVKKQKLMSTHTHTHTPIYCRLYSSVRVACGSKNEECLRSFLCLLPMSR